MIEQSGAIRKMRVEHADTVQYYLPMGDSEVPMNQYIGKAIQLDFLGAIHCLYCKRLTKKSFSQGFCYPCFRKLARCDQCIIKPELCHYHLGTCREPEWGQTHCMAPHIVYLANSSGLKVGITRQEQVPTRWIDQGATQALPIFKIKKRLDSGVIEVALKNHVADKTNWRKMLKNEVEPIDLMAARDRLMADAAAELSGPLNDTGAELCEHSAIVDFNYPVLVYPTKVSSHSFDKTSNVEGLLQGIKGQYLILDSGVINMRKFAGYQIRLTIKE